ncbi:MAG: FAD-dependent oxidoreductase [Flavobacteriaceae bacterium CG_4_8_14_3_um_filter_34_10]|nr:MAG: FAD-dependent oxidoreductase [Flavobacteriaceae bacterium CG18_big_fil_WC_8_21_14_2_50_34_36]PIX08580.1 MAG: FAD-dependent oxidoreductase [Flavobacteriaceae bacterium CG_4_8_14_3_um_filter_34_10]
MNIPKSTHPRIVIIGGGFGGISLVKVLRNKQVQIVLIDRHNYHTFQPLLYQVSTSGLEPDSIAYPLRKIFKYYRDFHFRMATVETIQAEKKKIITSIGAINYDYLVIASGSKTNFFGNLDIEQNSMPMKTVPQALNIRSLVLENFEKAVVCEDENKRKSLMNFVIAGAGPTGVELAGALAEFKNGIIKNDYPNLDAQEMTIHLIEGESKVLPPMSVFASKKAEMFLKKMGVNIHLNTYVKNYDGKTVTTNCDLCFETETFIWSAGVTGAAVQGLSVESFSERGNKYRVDSFSKVIGYEAIYAIGDIAQMKTEIYPNGHPMLAQPAIQQGKRLGKNLLLILQNKQPIPFNYLDKGAMATIGRNKAVVDYKKLHFGGFFAWFLWMFVHLWFLVGFRNRIVTFFNWTYNYINFDKAARLIIRPYIKGKFKE